MNFSRRSFATFATRRPQWGVATRLRRSAIPAMPSPFFRAPAPATQASMKIEPAAAPRAIAA